MEATASHPRIGRRPSTWLAAVLAGIAAAAVATTMALAVANRGVITTFDRASPIEIGIPLGLGAAGAVIAARRGHNPIGWILLAIAVITALDGTAAQLALLGLRAGRPTTVQVWAAWFGAESTSIVWPAGLVVFLFLLFPDGALPSPRWRPVAWAAVAMTLFLLFLSALWSPALEPFSGLGSIANPTAVTSSARVLEGPIGATAYLGCVGILVAAAASLVVRMRRASGETRAQLTWVVYAVVITVAAFVALIVISLIGFPYADTASTLIILAGFGVALPLAYGIAILKHGLYEIDVVIRRTVVYVTLAGFTTAVYLAIVAGAGAFVGRRNSLLTMLAAVIVAVSFQPVYRRATRFANRLVFGERATPYEVMSEFSERIRATVDSRDLMPRMARILAEGTAAERADVWLRVGDELRLTASWPAAADGEPAIRVPPGAPLTGLPNSDAAFPVEHAGVLLGALSVRTRAGDPLRAAERTLVSDLAAQAGLVLRNEQLTAELRARLDDLRAAQRRIVAAQDAERRRLERNIHDGAQQQLVALAVKAGLARGVAAREPERTQAMLDDLVGDAQGALETLRDLARGIYPPLLADRGLAAALDAQARKAPFPVDVHDDANGRYPQEIEAAAYFCCLEAPQNAAKYATCSRVAIQLAEAGDCLVFEISDDGVGFDTASSSSGSGLRGMADRLAALDGHLSIRSAARLGTTVTGRVPIGTTSPSA
jgi:signal transduction histidine kinase